MTTTHPSNTTTRMALVETHLCVLMSAHKRLAAAPWMGNDGAWPASMAQVEAELAVMATGKPAAETEPA